MVISICGKGGTGKTTVASLVVKYLQKNNQGPILAVDADPNANFAEMLGVEPPKPLVTILDELAEKRDNLPAGMDKNKYLEYEIQQNIFEGNGFDFLSMGRPEGPGCYCYANNTLRSILEKITKNYDYVVIDNEAGMEHISRRTDHKIDRLILVSDFSLIGLRSAKRILDLTGELKFKFDKVRLIINRQRGDAQKLKAEAEKLNLPEPEFLPYEPLLGKLSLGDNPVANLPEDSLVFKRLQDICSRIGL
jgi:CO dehydrogenase maturation factor